jgi:hypothetical protein
LARAKRTDRTEARRRTRAEQSAITSEGAVLATAGATSAGSTVDSKAAQPARPSITAAFRGSFRQVHVAEDLRSLPRLLIHWSFWGPALATVGATVLFLVYTQSWQAGQAPDTIGSLAVLALQMFVFPLPAPAGSSFIAGFGAPRASWLIGILIGVIAAACYAAVLYIAPTDLLLDLGMISSAGSVQDAALTGFLVAPIGASLFASAAAWYRRFLNLANPNRNQRRPQAAKPVQQGRGDIKRDRLSH